MFRVLCVKEFLRCRPDGIQAAVETYTRVIDWDDSQARRRFAERANEAIRSGAIVTTHKTDSLITVGKAIHYVNGVLVNK